MDCTEATAKTSVYLPRNPHSSPLYQCVRKHYEELVGSGVVLRRIEEQVLNRFIDCGDLHKGFARIYCDDCGHDYLLAFSCKTRYFCPSCHQKRMLAYGDWVDEEVLLPVPHRQYVFSRGDRRGSELSRIAKENETDAAGRLNTDPDNTDSEYIKDARSVWTRLIKKVYEVDPLICPHCGGEMRFLAVIEEAPVIERILRHIGVWDPSPPLRAPPDEDDWPDQSQIPLTYYPVPDIA